MVLIGIRFLRIDCGDGCPTLCNSFFFFLVFFSGPHPWHMEVSRRGVQSEL